MNDGDSIQKYKNILLVNKHVDLGSACRYYGLRKTGSKSELVERLLTYLVSAPQSDREKLQEALDSGQTGVPEHFPPANVRGIRVIQSGSPAEPDFGAAPVWTSSDFVGKEAISMIDPFFPVAPFDNPYLYATTGRQGSISFNLTVPDMKQWRRQGITVWLRGYSKSSSERQVWPRELRVLVNMVTVQKVEEPKRLKKRRDEPIDLTVFLQSGKNQIQLSVTDPNPSNFVLAVEEC